MFVVPDKSPDFLFELNGNRYAVPSVDSMPIDDLLAVNDLRDGDPIEAVRWFVAFVGRYCDGALDGMTVLQLKALMDAYFNAAKADVGE